MRILPRWPPLHMLLVSTAHSLGACTSHNLGTDPALQPVLGTHTSPTPRASPAASASRRLSVAMRWIVPPYSSLPPHPAAPRLAPGLRGSPAPEPLSGAHQRETSERREGRYMQCSSCGITTVCATPSHSFIIPNPPVKYWVLCEAVTLPLLSLSHPQKAEPTSGSGNGELKVDRVLSDQCIATVQAA